MSETKLSLFLVPAKLIDIHIVESVFERFGFDKITSFEISSLDSDDLTSLLYIEDISNYDTHWKVFVMADYCPRPQGWRKPSYLEPVDNARLYLMPYIRDFANEYRTLTNGTSFSLLWTANTKFAYALLEKWKPKLIKPIKANLAENSKKMQCPFPVIKEFGYWRNYCKVHLIEHNNNLAVCKIYRPGREKYLGNRLLVAERLANVKEVLPILDHGPNWFVIPYLENCVTLKDYRKIAGLLPLSVVNQLLKLVKKINSAALAHLDFHSEHVFINSKQELYVIDFDRIYTYDEAPPLETNIMLTGTKNIMKYDGPYKSWSYDNAWLHLTGLPLVVFLNGGKLKQFYWRSLYMTKNILNRLIRMTKNTLKRLIHLTRKLY
ncbi:MAG: hypothetical protein U5K69_18915 [Balneolaceae bacterium]|nr:hypothetical protein [Balneolaceae bacterium]